MGIYMLSCWFELDFDGGFKRILCPWGLLIYVVIPLLGMARMSWEHNVSRKVIIAICNADVCIYLRHLCHAMLCDMFVYVWIGICMYLYSFFVIEEYMKEVWPNTYGQWPNKVQYVGCGFSNLRPANAIEQNSGRPQINVQGVAVLVLTIARIIMYSR